MSILLKSLFKGVDKDVAVLVERTGERIYEVLFHGFPLPVRTEYNSAVVEKENKGFWLREAFANFKKAVFEMWQNHVPAAALNYLRSRASRKHCTLRERTQRCVWKGVISLAFFWAHFSALSTSSRDFSMSRKRRSRICSSKRARLDTIAL